MDNDRLTQEIEKVLNAVLSKKEEAEMRVELEKTLRDSATAIDDLTKSLEAKDVEHGAGVATLNETISDLESKVKDLTSAREALDAEKESFETTKAELTERAETAEAGLDNMKKDQLARERFDQLKESGVAVRDEKAAEGQISKIREMTEEDFDAFKDELVAVREAVLAEVKIASSDEEEGSEESQEEGEQADDASLEGEEEEASEEETDDEDEEAAAASEAAIQPGHAIASALNMEVVPGKDLVTKYAEMGQAMADVMDKKRNRD